MEDFFYHCSNFPCVDEKYVTEAKEAIYLKLHRPHVYRGIKNASFENTNFFKKLRKDLNSYYPAFLKWPANSYYDWHTDTWARHVSINIPLISSNQSVTLFRTEQDGTFFKIIKVDYTMLKPTILNVDHEHCVINYSDEHRYVLNIGIPNISYNEAVEYFKNLTIDNY